MVSRKRFLQLSALSFGSLLIPSILFSKNKKFSSSNLEDINTMLQAAKTYCKEKKWQLAKLKYEQILQAYPQEVRAYDGLRKCFYQKAKQESAYLQVLENAANQFPNNKGIQQRLCSQYINIATGNKKLSKLKNDNLLGLAQQKLAALQIQYPDDPCLQRQLLKVNRLVDINAGELHFKSNPELKKQHKQNQKTFKQRFNTLTDTDLSTKLEVLKSKEYKKEREKHIRELYLILIKRNVKNENTDNAVTISKEFYNLYPRDKSAIYWARRLYRKKGDTQFALEVESKNHQTKQSFWSASTYFATIKKHETSNTSLLQQLLMDMEQKKSDEYQNFLLQCRQIELLLLQNQNNLAETKINGLIQNKSGIRNSSIIDSVNILLIKYLKKIQQEDFIKTIPYIIINSKDLISSSNTWEQKIAKLNLNRNFTKPSHMSKLQSYINKV